MLRLELRRKHFLAESSFRLVDGGLVCVLHLSLVDRDCLDENDRQGAEHLLWLAVLEDAGLIVPTCAFESEAVNESTVSGRTFNLVNLLLRHLSEHHRLVKGPVVASCRRLHDCGKERPH